MNERRYNGGIDHLRSAERLQRLEVPRVVELCLQGMDAHSVLDVGVGSGVFAQEFAQHGLQVAGVDIDPQMVAFSKELLPKGVFQIAPAEQLPFEAKAFDLVFMGLVLHECDDAQQALQEAGRVTRQRAAILEWHYRNDEVGPPLGHRLKSEQVQEWAMQAGFNNVETYPFENVQLYLLNISTP
jgi:ubiquinone/menaquinone biosynthesis C-methylase UbiE